MIFSVFLGSAKISSTIYADPNLIRSTFCHVSLLVTPLLKNVGVGQSGIYVHEWDIDCNNKISL